MEIIMDLMNESMKIQESYRKLQKEVEEPLTSLIQEKIDAEYDLQSKLMEMMRANIQDL